MGLLQTIAAAKALLAASVKLDASGAALAIGLGLGLIAFVGVLSVWWRRLEAGNDPLRSLAPPARPLRLARDLEVRRSTD